MRVAVIGAGKMGLPLACKLAVNGAQIIACDTNPAVVEAINAGRSPIQEPGVEAILSKLAPQGRIKATNDATEAAAQSEVVIFIVPVLLTPDNHADLSLMEQATRAVAKGLQRGTLAIYETTLPIGETRRLATLLERESGLQCGQDFEVVFSPERVKSGTMLQKLGENPKVVGGLTTEGGARAEAFYRQYLGAPTINAGSPEAAELVKLAGILYRDVNIALANEIARYAEAVGVDFPAILDATNTDGEASILRPGIGVGGHCTPVYPHFVLRHAEKIGVPMPISQSGRNINDSQPDHVVDRLEHTLGGLVGRRVLILGLAFRPGVKEHTNSSAFALRDALERRGAVVSLHDPLYSKVEIEALGFIAGNLADRPAPDALILNTAHKEYATLDFQALADAGLTAVLDGRSFWADEKFENLKSRISDLTFERIVVGRPIGA